MFNQSTVLRPLKGSQSPSTNRGFEHCSIQKLWSDQAEISTFVCVQSEVGAVGAAGNTFGAGVIVGEPCIVL